jgi:hypothetical protein
MSRPKTERIHQDQKATAKTLRLIKRERLKVTAEEIIKMWARKRRKHRKMCSCNMCCNPRRSKITKGKEKLTQQEKKAITKATHP